MRFQIMHESPGRMRLRADVRLMSLKQADIIDAWLRVQPGVDDVTVHERTCGVIVIYHGDRSEICRMLSGFTYENAEKMLDSQTHSSRSMNRDYKEKLVFQVVRHCIKRLFLPVPLRRAITILTTLPRFVQAFRMLSSGR